MIELLNGRLVETDEERRAREDVRAWHFGKYREPAQKPEPVTSEDPGPLDPQPLPVTPAKSSRAARYRMSDAEKQKNYRNRQILEEQAAARQAVGVEA